MNLINFNCEVFINIEKPYYIQFIYNKNKFFSILDALEKHGIETNYQCRSGYCGSCRMILTKGHIQYFILPLASCILPKEILTCCCYPIDHIILTI